MTSVMGSAPSTTITGGSGGGAQGSLDSAVFDYFTATDAVFVTASPALGVIRNSHPLVVYPYSALGPITADADFQGVRYVWLLPISGNILVRLLWAAETAIAGGVEWFVAFERDDALGVNLNVNSFAPAKSVVSAAPPVAGQLREAQITFTPAEYDGILAGEAYRMRISRTSGGAGPDTMLDDAQLFRVILGAI